VKIDELLDERRIFLNVEAADKTQVIKFLNDSMSNSDGVKNPDLLLKDILKRESEIPTGLEYGCAIPHARSEGVDKIVLAFARLKDGVDFGAPDKSHAKLIFQFGVPSDKVNLYLKILARLCRLLKKGSLREKLLNAQKTDEIVQAFAGK